MFNIKIKKGFTLIELLVVIGILAVLAAIAIPSVAGLIDRANVSADNSNATAMTNAIEQFTSELELVKQDIASGVLDENNLDSVQSRIFNTFKINERKQITDLESVGGFNGYGIDINTKYPVNELTFKSVVVNYLKTTSETFIPKQSDKAFYYSPEIGVVIVAEDGSTTDELNKVALVDEDGVSVNNKGFVTLSVTQLADDIEDNNVQWINLTLNALNEKKGVETTNVYVSTDTKNQYTTLRNDVFAFDEYDSQNSGLFIPGTKEHIKINVNGKIVDATWENLIIGNYINFSNGRLSSATNTNLMSGEFVASKNVIEISGNGTTNSFLKGSSVESVILNEGLIKIASGAFYNASIKKLYISSTVSNIGDSICIANPIEEIIINENNIHYTIYNNALYTKDYKRLLRYPSNKYLNTFEMHPNTETLSAFAFTRANIDTIIFNESLTKVEKRAFSYASAKDIYINNKADLSSEGIFNMTTKATLHIDNNYNVELYNNCIYSKDYKKLYGVAKQNSGILQIKDGTEIIENAVNTTVKTVIIPKSVKKINGGFADSIKNIYYCGTEEEWQNLVINSSTIVIESDLSDINIIFNYS